MEHIKRPIWTKSFVSVSLTHFIVFVTFYALLTTLPIYVIDKLGGNEAQGGLVVTIMLLAAIIVRPFSGKLLEKLGKKKTLVLSILLFTITTFFYLVASQYEALLVLRFIHGLSFAILTTTTGAIAADVVPAERRGEGLGYFAMSMNIAVVVGPFIGLTMLQVTSFTNLFLVLSGIMVAGVISSILIQLPAQAEKEQPESPKKLSFHDLFDTKAFPISFIACMIAFSYSSIISFISVYAHSLGLSSVSSYFFVVFAIVMILSRPSLGRAFDSRGPNIVIIPSLIVFATGLVTLGFIQSIGGLLLAGAIIGLGYGSLLPSFQTMAIQSTSDHRSGHATATFFTLYDTGIALGSYVLGILVSLSSFTVLYNMSALLVVAVLGIYYMYQKK